MSENVDVDSDHDAEMDGNSSDDDGYIEDEFDYRHFFNPMLYNLPADLRRPVRRLAKDIARVSAGKEIVRRQVEHFRIVQEQTETCMYENCNKLTSGKCGRCHVFLCIDSESCCFDMFHETD